MDRVVRRPGSTCASSPARSRLYLAPRPPPPRCCCSAPLCSLSSPCQRSPFFVIPVPLALSRDAPDRPARVPHAQPALGRLHPRHGRLRRAIRTHPSLAALSPSRLAGAIFSLPLVRQVPRGQHPGRPGQRVARRRARGGRARRQRRRQQRPAAAAAAARAARAARRGRARGPERPKERSRAHRSGARGAGACDRAPRCANVTCTCVAVVRDRSFARARRQRPAHWLSGSARLTSRVGHLVGQPGLSCFVAAAYSPENVFHSDIFVRLARSPVTHTGCLYGCMAPPVHQLSVQPDTL